MPKGREEILEYLRSHRQELREHYGVVTIGLFGSIATDSEREDSDVDLAVELERGYKTLRNFMALKERLESALERPVDLGIESTLKPLIHEKIRDEIIYV